MPGPDWVQHICTGNDNGSRTGEMSADEKFFVENHARATTLVESTDPESNYSYDDYALAELDGELYVFNTSGCSCPSPSETWDLQIKGGRGDVIAWANSHDSYNSSAFHEFKRALEAYGFEFATKAPAPAGTATDW